MRDDLTPEECRWLAEALEDEVVDTADIDVPALTAKLRRKAEAPAPDHAALVSEIRSLASEVGTVMDVAKRRSDPDHDHRQMIARLDQWRARLHAVEDRLRAAAPAVGVVPIVVAMQGCLAKEHQVVFSCLTCANNAEAPAVDMAALLTETNIELGHAHAQLTEADTRLFSAFCADCGTSSIGYCAHCGRPMARTVGSAAVDVTALQVVNQRLRDALAGVVGLIQLQPVTSDRLFMQSNHRYVEAVEVLDALVPAPKEPKLDGHEE